MKQIWLYISKEDLGIERDQCREEGKDISALESRFDELLAAENIETPENQKAARELLDETAALPIKADFPYTEPSDLEGIRAARGTRPQIPAFSLSDEEHYNKVYGAWLGRCSGCLLGKPVEGWRRPRMLGYLNDTGRYPLSYYFSNNVSDEVKKNHDIGPGRAWIETVDCMPEDDDTNYTTTGMAMMKQKGSGFTPEDVAMFWMTNIPIIHTCTAERVAYKNFVLLIAPPESASFRNPYREWIGAQIRADFFGYAAPGNPELAAEYAWRDASISHVKNGIYGEMFVAAMIAAAFVTDDVKAIINAGLGEIPAKSRLHESIEDVMAWHASGMSYDEAVEKLHSIWNEHSPHHWCHTISNAIVVVIGMLWGELDFEKSITRAVMPCFDTDCNGATVGSIVGTILGAKKLPGKWIDPLNNKLHTGVAGYNEVKISDMARETIEIIRKFD